MIGVSAGYLAAQASHGLTGARRVTLYRRNWSGSGWEGTGVDITAEVRWPNLDRITDKLDTVALNEFKVGNLSAVVDNTSGLWVQGSSRFPNGTFLLFRSKVVVELGIVVAGVPELFPRFTGIIEDVPGAGADPVVTLDIRSTLQLLESADADRAAISVLAENLGTGDGVTAEFLAANTGVAEFLRLLVDGSPLRPGLRWSQSQLDDPDQRGKVSFSSSQPDVGQSIVADYRRWKRDLRIEQAVADLVAVEPDMGVDTIQPVTFTPPPVREIVHTTQGDFNAYTQKRTRVVAEPEPPVADGAITLDPLDTKAEWDTRINSSVMGHPNRVVDGLHPRWTAQYEATHLPGVEYFQVEGDATLPWVETVPSGTTRSVSNSILTVNHPAVADYVVTGQRAGGSTGTSRYFATRARVVSGSGTLSVGAYMTSGPDANKGATIRITTTQVQLISSTTQTHLLDATQFHSYEVRVDRTAQQARLYVDGVLVLTQTLGTSNPDSLANGSVNFKARDTSGTGVYEIDMVRFNAFEADPALADFTIETDYQPHLGGLTSFSLITTLGPFYAVYQGAAQSQEYFWSSSNDGVNFTAETAISLGGNVGAWTNTDSPKKVRLRVKFRDGAASAPGAITQLWLPGIAHVVIDGGTGVVSWDTWTHQKTDNNGSVQVFTASHNPSGLPFLNSFYAALGGGNTIQSDNNQQAATFGMPTHMNFIVLLNTGGTTPPQLRESIINLTTNQILLTLANYGRGSKVLPVLRDITGITDHVLGVRGNGAFFFKPRAIPGSPSKTLDDSNVLEVLASSPGWDRVFNIIRATFGNFRAVANAASEGEGTPTSEAQFDDRPLDLPGTNLLFQKDVDLATALVKRFFARLRAPKRLLTVRVVWSPEVELLDRVAYNVVKPRQIGPANLDAIVVGATQDPVGWTTELDLLEV